MSAQGRWSDLTVRMGSGAVMVALGLGAVAAGGDVFHVFIAVICGAMVWELVRMLAPDTPTKALQLGGLSGTAILIAIYLPPLFVFPVLLAPALVGISLLASHRMLFMVFAALVALAGYEMMLVRDSFGFVWMLWLVMIVVMSDVAGYFAGKSIGGPKIWPRVSPNKTWSGPLAGWAGGAQVGLIFVIWQEATWALIPFSVLVALAAQAGDIAESAVKRRVGVKDSSALIPGHGGLLDRFDGMLGASVFVLFVGAMVGLPPGAG